MKKPSCLNPTCSLHGNVASRHIIRYGFYRTTAGKRRRYRCIRCGQTFSTTKGTWLCNEGTISEAKKFATENRFDCIRLRKRIDGWEVRTTDFDWVSPKERHQLLLPPPLSRSNQTA